MCIAAGVIGGVLGLAGNAGGTIYQADQGRKSMHEQIDFQREMSNTAYQRATKDMQAAGLNPMLAYSQGGASTPSGAQMQVPDSTKLGSSAVASAQQATDMANTKAQVDVNRAQATKVATDAVGSSWDNRMKEAQFYRMFPEQVREQTAHATSAEYKANYDRDDPTRPKGEQYGNEYYDWLRRKFGVDVSEYDSKVARTKLPWINRMDELGHSAGSWMDQLMEYGKSGFGKDLERLYGAGKNWVSGLRAEPETWKNPKYPND